MTGAGTYERFPPFCTLSAGPVFRRAGGGGCLPTEYVRSRTKGGEKAGESFFRERKIPRNLCGKVPGNFLGGSRFSYLEKIDEISL